jgi:hypothetical protein
MAVMVLTSCRKRWRHVNFSPILVTFKRFDDERAAALSYDKAARIAFGEFACPNLPPEASAGTILPMRALAKHSDEGHLVRRRG